VINRKRFFALFSGGAIGSVVPKALEAKEVFERAIPLPPDVDVACGAWFQFPKTDTPLGLQNASKNELTEFTFAKDGALWITRGNKAKKLV